MSSLIHEFHSLEKNLIEARAGVANAAYHRWQRERLNACDRQLSGLAAARADYEALKRIYCESRDRHRSLRQRIRRNYYALVRQLGVGPSAEPGIESKALTLVAERRPRGGNDQLDALAQTLDACRDAKLTEQRSASMFCRAHNRLLDLMTQTKRLAHELLVGSKRLTPLALPSRENSAVR